MHSVRLARWLCALTIGLSQLVSGCDADTGSSTDMRPTPDAGDDAALDGSAPDATLPDAALPDGALPDADLPDAASLDGGERDAAPPGQPPPLPAPHPFARADRPLVIAHRGGARLAPENTLPAFEAALAAGADVLETDARATADGVVVLIHDHTVDRTTDGEGEVAALTLAELEALDAGHGYSPDRGETFPRRGEGIRVPTLDAALAAFPDALFAIELKPEDPAFVAPFLAVIDAHDARHRIVVASREAPVIAALRAAAPDIATGLATTEVLTWITLPPGPDARPWQPPGHVLQIPLEQLGFELVTPPNIAHARRHGVAMHAFTINDEATMRQLAEWGIDGIMTDDPVTLRAVIDTPR